jgi:hypothetical protein
MDYVTVGDRESWGRNGVCSLDSLCFCDFESARVVGSGYCLLWRTARSPSLSELLASGLRIKNPIVVPTRLVESLSECGVSVRHGYESTLHSNAPQALDIPTQHGSRLSCFVVILSRLTCSTIAHVAHYTNNTQRRSVACQSRTGVRLDARSRRDAYCV